MDLEKLEKICRLVRYDILTSTTAAGSGHPTSSLSGVELMTTLFFSGFFRQDLENPHEWYNDRFILSKGHASPLLYSLYQAAGAISREELMSLRKLDSPLEGHPTPRFKYADVATGSLGQGLSVGLGMALGIELRIKNSEFRIKRVPKVWVLLGDSEFSEGQVYEALELSSYYKASNLIGILDVNRLGQRGETMLGWNIHAYERRISSFGWNTIVLEDGYDLKTIYNALNSIEKNETLCPTMIIAKTIKGKGVSFLENKEGWHGKALNKEQLGKALKELGNVDLKLKGEIIKPSEARRHEDDGDLGGVERSETRVPTESSRLVTSAQYKIGAQISTREAYGRTLELVGQTDLNLIVLDAEVSNSTFAEYFKEEIPNRYFEMFIAEQNMISVALGFSKLGFTPFASSFAAFFTRAFDQIRMSQYSMDQNKLSSGQTSANLKLVGSHAGVSIGQDGPSQMGLEDLAMMRVISDSVVLYPSDAVSTARLTESMAKQNGLFYLRTTREKTPVIYDEKETFVVGGSKILRQTDQDIATVIACGITLHEALKAYEQLKKDGIPISVVDLYSIKPLDEKTLYQQAKKTKNILVVEDHYEAGGVGEAVLSVLNNNQKIIFNHLCVRKLPRSGNPDELLNYEEINSAAIINAVTRSMKE